jgi:hypothetical protein
MKNEKSKGIEEIHNNRVTDAIIQFALFLAQENNNRLLPCLYKNKKDELCQYQFVHYQI